MEEFLRKMLPDFPGHSGKTPREPCLPEDGCPLGSHRTFLLVWFVLAALLREFNEEFYRLYRILYNTYTIHSHVKCQFSGF